MTSQTEPATVDFAHTAFAEERRKEKARALGRFLWLNGNTLAAARRLSSADWRAAAHTIGKNPPGPQTRGLALQWLDWLWRTQGAPPQPPRPEPEPEPAAPVAPVHTPPVKGQCRWPGCDQPGRLYPEGTRCDPHSPWSRRGHPFQDDLKAQADAALAAKTTALSASPT